MAGRWRIGCDIGGTFTDFVAIDTARNTIHAEKLLTTPEDPSLAVLQGIEALRRRAGDALSPLDMFVHGTTLVINALIQRQGAKIGLLATEGFTDVVEMRREVRYDSYDLFADFPAPLAERPFRLGVRERLYSDGSVRLPLDEEQALGQIRHLRAQGVEAFAVCLLHAYNNPAHELRLRELIVGEDPAAFVSLSSEVLPEIREYERTSAVTANAFVQPLVAKYLERMVGRLEDAGCKGKVYLMLSNGGLASLETARTFPIRIVESGPAAGAMAAEHFANQLDLPNLLSFDMGGTTAKSVLVKDGRLTISTECEVARVHRFKKGSGIPLRLPFVDLMEIGAGGGSLARVNEMGLIQVGPESAGSVPGPACYGRGGENPTVTDANLVLGYLSAAYFLGGDMSLDVSAAIRAVDAELAGRLDLTVLQAAWGVHDIVNERMAAAAKIHLAEKGETPARLAMIAFGGAGPLHASGLAQKLGINTIVVPPFAGILSAVGFFAAPVSFDTTATYKVALSELDPAHLDRLLTSMRASVGKFLSAEPSAITFTTELELRYAGQGFEVAMTLPEGPLPDAGSLCRQFEETYQRIYGRVYADVEAELMNLHVTGRLAAAGFELPRPAAVPAGRGGHAGGLKGERRAYDPGQRRLLAHAVYERSALAVGAELVGPAIIEERECTTLLPVGARLRVHETGTLFVTLNSARQ